jgi:hypothetical protein
MVRVGPRLVYYHIWSCPLGFKLARILSTGASQKYQISYIEFSQFYLWVSPCPCLFQIYLQVCDGLESIRLGKSFSFASFGPTGVSIAVRKLRCFISSCSTASAPYINQNSVKFVALHTVVLWLHTTVVRTSAHLPFFSPSSIFLIALKIREFALSTVPLDCGWYTDVNATFIPICWQKSLNIALSNYFALSVVICWGHHSGR